jgi:hypothetical protein
MQRRALARPGRPQERNELAFLDPQAQPPERDGLGRARAVDLEDVVQLERPEGQLVSLLRLTVEAPQLHRKLSIISR